MTEYIVEIINRHTGKKENESDPFDNFQDANEWGKDSTDSETRYVVRPWRG